MKNAARAYLAELGNKSVVGIEPQFAAQFNKWIKQQSPDTHAKSVQILKEITKTKAYYGRTCYHYIHHPCLSRFDPYPNAPTKAQLLADIAFVLL